MSELSTRTNLGRRGIGLEPVVGHGLLRVGGQDGGSSPRGERRKRKVYQVWGIDGLFASSLSILALMASGSWPASNSCDDKTHPPPHSKDADAAPNAKPKAPAVPEALVLVQAVGRPSSVATCGFRSPASPGADDEVSAFASGSAPSDA